MKLKFIMIVLLCILLITILLIRYFILMGIGNIGISNMRLIDADALINYYAFDLDNNFVVDVSDIRDMPTIEAEPVRHGRWIPWDGVEGTYQCSVCGADWDCLEGTPMDNEMYYCPNCGAIMDEAEI